MVTGRMFMALSFACFSSELSVLSIASLDDGVTRLEALIRSTAQQGIVDKISWDASNKGTITASRVKFYLVIPCCN